MAVRKKAKATTNRKVTPRISAVKRTTKHEAAQGGFSEYFRFSESYTSLILGIVVVIIASVLLISFLRGREFRNTPPPAPEISSAKIEPDATATPISGEPVQEITSTIVPTITQAATPTMTPAQKVSPTVTTPPKVTPQQPAKGSYVVKSGDDLWKIAEAQYKDGYKWTMIAKENNITNPGMIFTGQVLKIPAVSDKDVAKTTDDQSSQPSGQKGNAAGMSYTIKRGDTLWSIAEKQYKNGYRWVDIAKANNLTNPGLIHADNVLTLPN